MNIAFKKKQNIFVYSSVFLITLSLLSYMVLLARLFSVILSYNLVFLVVSFSVLGSGLSGIFTYIQLKEKKYIDTRKMTENLSTLLAISILGTVLVIFKLPYIRVYSLYALIGMIPFAIGGGIISIILKEFIELSSKLYVMDLIGLALGSIVIIRVMNIYGFMSSVVIITVVAIIASTQISIYFKEKKRLLAKSFFVILLLGVLVEGDFIKAIENGFSPYYSSPNTVMSYLKDTIEKPLNIPYSKWNAVSRTDILETTNQNEKKVVKDGRELSPIVKFGGDLNKVDYLKEQVNFVPFAIGKNDKTLVIGSGGGKDVLLALVGGSKDISAVEFNSSTIEAVERYKEFSGNIYNRPEVKLYIQDGRNFIQNSKEMYDNVYLSTGMPSAIENTKYSLSENYLFTEEAFKLYFDKLAENGKLSFRTNSTLDMTRIVNTGIKVLMDKGVKHKEISKYFTIINGESEINKHIHNEIINRPMIIFKKSPFNQEEITSLLNIVGQQNGFMIHCPNEEYEVFSQLENSDMIEAFNFNVAPINDNKPFFYNYSNIVPRELIFIGIILLIIWIIIKQKYIREKKESEISKYFIVIGMSFMLIEISFVQKTSLYFGSSITSLSSVLFSILVSSGIGCLLSGYKKIKVHICKSSLYLLCTSISVITTLFTINKIVLTTNEFNLGYKIITIFFVLLPMGMLMGIPFPIGIRKLKENVKNVDIVPLMWGVNGIFSVIGSIMAISISMKLGFNITIIVGSLLYLYLYIINPLRYEC